MTLSEFKAWFDGFTESLDGAPNEKQWERIKARVSEINGTVTTYPVYVDRYVYPYRRYMDYGPIWATSSSGPLVGSVSQAGSFNSSAAMLEFGKAEYKAMVS